MVSDKRCNAKLMVKDRDYFVKPEDIVKYLKQHGLKKLEDSLISCSNTPSREYNNNNECDLESTFKISSKTHGRLTLPVRTVDDIDEDITRLVSKNSNDGAHSDTNCNIAPAVNEDAMVTDCIDAVELVSRINDLKALSRALLVSLVINANIETKTEYTIEEMHAVCNEYSRKLGMNAKSVDELKYYVEDLREKELLREIIADEKYLIQIDMNSILLNCDGLEDAHREAMGDYFNSTQSY
jgi:hypothetical protein